MEQKKGFYLCNKKYYYCSETNTLVNGEFAEIYKKYSGGRNVQVTESRVDIDSVRNSLKKVKQIIFESTQKCNLKCAYCAYESGEYKYNRQPESSRSIRFGTARKSLRQVWKVIKDRDSKELTIGFYGGEPLLNFETIKKIVAYVKELFREWSVKFIITTNGTLLNQRIIDYIIGNNFMTYVSLDGPQINHDAKRVLRSGKGSFKKVIKNLELLRTTNEDYYENRVFFSAVSSKDLSIENVIDFFNNEELVRKNDAKLGYVNSTDTTYYDKFPYDVQEFNRSMKRIFESIKTKKMEKKELSSIERDLCTRHNILLESLLMERASTLMGTCFYDSRLYVDSDGGFHVCEKINNSFQFGNAHDGFDYDRMVEIATQYIQLLKKSCSQCEIRFLCNKCYIHFAKDGAFRMAKEYCTKEKRAIKKMLEDAIYFQEKR